MELEGEMRHEKNAIAEVKRFMNKDALDLTMPKEDGTMWDLSISDDKMLIDKFIKRYKPKSIIGTSMIGQVGNDVLHMGRAIDHTRGLCEVYNRQLNAGGHILHVHFVEGSTWRLDCLKLMQSRANMHVMTKKVNNDKNAIKFMTSHRNTYMKLEVMDTKHMHMAHIRREVQSALGIDARTISTMVGIMMSPQGWS